MKNRSENNQSRPELWYEGYPAATKLVFLWIMNIFALCLIAGYAFQRLNQPLQFDDAFMFERYAFHFRNGLGISWNLDGVHTGGMTSLGWFLAVLPGSYFPLREGQPLAMASFATGLIGILILAWQISKLSSSTVLRQFWLVLPMLVLLLNCTHIFRANMITGMDTMLSFTLNGALSVSIWSLCERKDDSFQFILVGFLGACAVIVRPENGLLATAAPLLAVLLLMDRQRRIKFIWLAMTFGVVMLFYVISYHAYFHAWLPLSFYMKSQHPYRGYVGAVKWAPEKYLVEFIVLSIPMMAFPLMGLDRKTLRVAAIYMVPVALTFVYLHGVTQIMGAAARYYVPFIAPVLVAACWMSDLTLQKDWPHILRRRLRVIAASWLAFGVVAAASWRPLMRRSANRLHVEPYAAARLITPAASSLPERPWLQVIMVLANQVIKLLPAETVVAASEVGIIGADAPNVNVIDLAGLNDNDIALHGFDMNRLLDRNPLIIWFPHSDYTWQRQVMFCSPKLIDKYIVIGGKAFNYSIAIRRDTHETEHVMKDLAEAFSTLYPDARITDYIVSEIACTQ
jgi:hypothetical protein